MTDRPRPRLVLLAFALAAGAFALAAAPRRDEEKPRIRQEYLNQQVQADAIVQTLNDLDAQGWDLFQVVPVWQIDNANGNAAFSAKSYQVFGRRPVKGQ